MKREAAGAGPAVVVSAITLSAAIGETPSGSGGGAIRTGVALRSGSDAVKESIMFQMLKREGIATGSKRRIMTIAQSRRKALFGNSWMNNLRMTITAKMIKEADRLILRIFIFTST